MPNTSDRRYNHDLPTTSTDPAEQIHALRVAIDRAYADLAEAHRGPEPIADEPIKCHFCEATVADVDAAVEADWAPSFYAAGDEYETPEPVCPVCWGKYMEVDESGELVQVTE